MATYKEKIEDIPGNEYKYDLFTGAYKKVGMPKTGLVDRIMDWLRGQENEDVVPTNPEETNPEKGVEDEWMPETKTQVENELAPEVMDAMTKAWDSFDMGYKRMWGGSLEEFLADPYARERWGGIDSAEIEGTPMTRE